MIPGNRLCALLSLSASYDVDNTPDIMMLIINDSNQPRYRVWGRLSLSTSDHYDHTPDIMMLIINDPRSLGIGCDKG